MSLLKEGVHSGDGSGIFASSFRVARLLLDRLEDASTGAIKLEGLNVAIPEGRRLEAQATAASLGERVWTMFPTWPGVRPISALASDLLLNRSWRPMLEITGAGGLPTIESAGNVLRDRTELLLSLRLPPTVDALSALERVRGLLTADPPYGARVSFEGQSVSGWDSLPFAPWLESAIDAASRLRFGQPPGLTGEGGSIPFIAMLAARFPDAQFVITGVLGPGSNAHGPNEFLDIPTAERVTLCVADILQAQLQSQPLS